MGCHVSTIMAWFSLAILNTVATHSGYTFPGVANPRRHDYHHEHFNENFGYSNEMHYKCINVHIINISLCPDGSYE
jgi:hypothetical protein